MQLIFESVAKIVNEAIKRNFSESFKGLVLRDTSKAYQIYGKVNQFGLTDMEANGHKLCFNFPHSGVDVSSVFLNVTILPAMNKFSNSRSGVFKIQNREHTSLNPENLIWMDNDNGGKKYTTDELIKYWAQEFLNIVYG